jgi:uncharacterized membrane protein YoaK (UPF0700 family)
LPRTVRRRGGNRYAAAMLHYDRRLWLLAASLSALAGYVDAIGFLKLGGFFVSFMSGNSTRLGVGLAGWTPAALTAGALVLAFVAGVMAGTVVAHAAGMNRRVAVLALVSGLLLTAAGLGGMGLGTAAIAAMALAMGAENAVFERNGEVSIGLTYMTGTLVKFGQRLAGVFLGGQRYAWAPYLLLWLGLVAGGIGGALAYPHLGLGALWIAAAAAVALTFVAAAAGPERH